ncbi:polymorphic toxin-type HINT domain-containing protein [Micromonospora sp. NPDC126480]|uniref:polymorphic toxin-type HINT domain-containing protein n=1 Tax=Micromonospora sp. NPDC126480 TaxID=3155312 RepID=UPI00331DDBFF
MVGSLVASLLGGVPAALAAPAAEPGGQERPVPVSSAATKPKPLPKMPAFVGKKVVWPSTGSAVVDLPLSADRSRRLQGTAKPGGLPVAVTAVDDGATDVLSGRALADAADASELPGKVRVEVLDRKAAERAGVALALKVARADGAGRGRAEVRVDYSAFAHAYGGDWAWRLRLAKMPACALTTPEAEQCGQVRWLDSVNDGEAGVVTAEVDLAGSSPVTRDAGTTGVDDTLTAAGGEVMVLTASGSSSESGDFSKTDLKESSTWAVSGNSGSFTYAYPMEAPPVPGGLVPQVGLGYSSGAVDGQTAGSNTQPSTFGEGWNYTPGFIERTYRACVDDSENSPYWTSLNYTGDLCWRLPNAQIMLNGISSEIVLGDDGKWRLGDDDGSKVELLTGAGNGDNDGEHWKITTTDGTEYWFGRHALPNGKGYTNSTPVVPVFANHSGEPCFSTSSAGASRCQQAWRWMLDYVVDRNGNEISYWYGRATVFTGLMNSASTTAGYHREVYLNRIDYGTHKSDASTVSAPARMVFTNSDRCVTTSCGTHDEANWPDTPWDLECLSAPCSNNLTPTFWSTRRVSKISTEVLKSGSYSVVDEWAIGQSFPSAPSPVLWLSSIQRTGKSAGTSVTLPKLLTYGTKTQNRADYDPNATMQSHEKYRITKLQTETGGQVDVTYAAPDTGCAFGGSFPNPDNNSKRCFPQYYTNPSGQTGWAWWHKRIVAKVVAADLLGGSPPITTEYSYSTANSSTSVLWGHSDGAAVWGAPLAKRSWSDWAGYTNVTVRKGNPTGTRSQVDYLYLRGLHGDRTDSGTRTVSVTPFDSVAGGGAATDAEYRRGHLLNERTYDQAGGSVVQILKHDPWTSTTGTRTLSTSWAVPNVHKSYINRTGKEIRWEWVDGAWSQRFLVDTSYDSTFGRVLTVSDEGGPATDDQTCTTYTYADNPATYKYAFVARKKITSGSCSGSLYSLLGDTRYYYDGLAYVGDAPGRGNVTKSESWKDAKLHFPADGWVIASQNVVYNPHGQVTSATDALGRTTTTTYTENADRLATQMTVTNPAGHAVTSTFDVTRGLPLTVTDANGKVTTGTYDALGRTLSVTKPGNTTGTPDEQYGYSLSQTAPSWVSTKSLGPNGTQVSSYEIYDGLLRHRQSQATAADGKRVITERVYDERGLTIKDSLFWNTDSAPTSTLVTAADSVIERQTRFAYDGRGRQTAAELWSLDAYKWKTTTAYAWNSTTVTPPAGSFPTRNVVDDHGRVVEKRQYHTADTSGAHDTTRYDYNLRNELVSVTDPAGNIWRYSYDLLGRQRTVGDPDAGTSVFNYDDAGQVTSIRDGRDELLAFVYDNLGRKTEMRDDTTTGTLRAKWVYDTLAKGQLTSATRYDTDGLAYTTSVGSYDDAYRPRSTTVTIPASTANGVLAGTYTTSMTYKANGAPATISLPGVGGLPTETLTYTYLNQGLLTSVSSGQQTYLADVDYAYDGLPYRTYLGAAGKQVRFTTQHATSHRRLMDAQVHTENQTTPGTWDDKFSTQYAYQDNGLIAVIAGKTNGVRDQVECFDYDYQHRLVEAWTEASWNCATPQRAGADPYWRQWTFDTVGNRTTQVDKDPGGDTTWTYTTPAAGQPQPHTLISVSATGPKAGTPTRSFTYDAAGNTLTRTTETGAGQTLTWDPEGHLDTLTESGQTTRYLYDADGNRLISRAPDKTTLYLGNTELELTTGSTQPDGTRHYDGYAVRDVTGLKWTINNHQGTSNIQIDPGTLASQRRRSMPYGEERGTTPTPWLGTKGFVGGTTDDTGLTHLGAREYDPTLGRFISVDPIQDLADTQQWHGYAYSNNSPITFSDPSGLIHIEGNSQSEGGQIGYQTDSGVTVTGQPLNQPATPPPPPPPPTTNNLGQATLGVEPGVTEVWTLDHIATLRFQAGYDQIGTWEQGQVLRLVFCHNNPKRCAEMEAEENHQAGEFFAGLALELSGYNDAKACVGGSVSGCAWTGVALIPIVGKAAGTLGKSFVKWATKFFGKACSFSGDTHVLMADGSTKAIRDVQVGDVVLATDPETGEEGPRTVVRLWVHEDQLVDLKLAGGEVVTTTEDHPFWNQTDQQWQASQDLDPGDTLRTASGGSVAVNGIEWDTFQEGLAYNLTVADIHTYYVMASNTPVLVHNTGCDVPVPLGPHRPAGTGDNWVARTADNGKGQVWQAPGATGNADMVRVMNPTTMYPNGYVRFYNGHGQPIGLNGKPGSKAETHIPMNSDGTYPLPNGW